MLPHIRFPPREQDAGITALKTTYALVMVRASLAGWS
jgi:hypothetical protein